MLVLFKLTAAFHQVDCPFLSLPFSGVPLEHEGTRVSGGRRRGSLHKILQATEWGTGGALYKISFNR
jgi:hypothetical protein